MKTNLYKHIPLLSIAIFCFIFTSCINFKPNKQAEDNSNIEKEETVDNDPKDDEAMDKNDHLKFKGIPIDGSFTEFIARMKRKGFSLEECGDGKAILSGTFADFNECYVYVETLDTKDLVYRISVAFPAHDQWKHLYGDYKHLKELLTEKYGKPASCVEKFQKSYVDNDNDRIWAIKQDAYKYETTFTTEKGELLLCITHNGYSNCNNILIYKDKKNTNIIKQQAKDEL